MNMHLFQKHGTPPRYGYRVGVVGCGNIAHVQTKYILDFIDKQNLALCDPNAFRMRWLSRRLGVKNLYHSLDSLLSEFSPDIVHILTPPHTHKNIALECLAGNAHLFLEKPMCLSPEEAMEIQEAAGKAGRLVCVDHLLPFDPLLVKAGEILKRGALGELQGVKITEFRNYIDSKRAGMTPGWMKNLPGELLFDILPHPLSVLNAFLPNLTLTGAMHHGQGRDVREMLCLFAAGRKTAVIHTSIQNTYRRVSTIRFECNRGCVTVDLKNHTLAVLREDRFHGAAEEFYQSAMAAGEVVRRTLKIIPGRIAPQTSYIGMGRIIGRYYRAVKDRLDAPVSCEDGRKVMCQIKEIFDAVGIGNAASKIPSAPSRASGTAVQRSTKADILVTGGTGFIGARLVNRLLEAGYSVRLLTRRSPDALHREHLFSAPVELVEADISNLSAVENACSGVNTVFHLAAATKGGWLNHVDATVCGTSNIMHAIYSAGVQRLIYVSTLSLLHHSRYPSRTLVRETFPYEQQPAKRDPYCYAKLWAEKIVRACTAQPGDIPIIILRPGIVYGPGKLPAFLFPERKGGIRIIGWSGRRILPLVYLDNLVDALIQSLHADRHGIYNVVDEEIVTTRALIRRYDYLTGQRSRTVYFPVPLLLPLVLPLEKLRNHFSRERVYPSYRLKSLLRSPIHSSEKIKDELGWAQRIDFSQGMKLATGYPG